jgi:hypothetical protein
MMAGMLGAALVTSLWVIFPFRAPRRSFGCWARTFTGIVGLSQGTRRLFDTRWFLLVQWT